MRCEYCLQYPHDPRCPDAEEPEAIHICEECGEPIFAGEDCWKDVPVVMCDDCANDPKILRSYIGLTAAVAGW